MPQTHSTLTDLQRLLREASLQLVEGMFAQDASSACYGFLQLCQQSLNEAQNVMRQLSDELEQPSASAASPQPAGEHDPQHESTQEELTDSKTPDLPKRGRGRAKGRYLRDNTYEPQFRQHLVSIFSGYYIEEGDAFRSADGTETLSASVFLACLYSVGVERGITAPSPSVKPMTDIIDDLLKPTSSPHHIPSYITSYKTIMGKVNDWRTLVTRQKRNLAHLYLHDIIPSDLAEGQLEAYEDWLHALHEVERIYDLTLPTVEERNA